MDPMTASYYRAILFRDSQDTRPIPPTLVLLHAWAFKRFQAMGAGSVISKQAALCVAMTWMASTKEGRAFAIEHTTIGELFVEDEGVVPGDQSKVVDWDSLAPETMVTVSVNEKKFDAKFAGRRGGWIDVLIGGEKKQYRSSQVQLAGA